MSGGGRRPFLAPSAVSRRTIVRRAAFPSMAAIDPRFFLLLWILQSPRGHAHILHLPAFSLSRDAKITRSKESSRLLAFHKAPIPPCMSEDLKARRDFLLLSFVPRRVLRFEYISPVSGAVYSIWVQPLNAGSYAAGPCKQPNRNFSSCRDTKRARCSRPE